MSMKLLMAVALVALPCLPAMQEGPERPDPAAAVALLDQGGAVLHYRVSTPEGAPADRALVEATAKVLRARLADERAAAVRIVEREGAPHLQVVLAGRDAGPAEALAERLERPGRFALRLVARTDGPVDAAAVTEAVQGELLRRAAGEAKGPLPAAASEGAITYRWVPTTAAAEAGWTDHAVLVDSIDGKTTYVLVEEDRDHDFTEQQLAQVRVGVDRLGQPSLDIEFEDAAAASIRAFTGAHQDRALGILIDGELVQAPTLRGVVSSRAMISGGSGGFPLKHVQELAAVLGTSARHGPLPGTIARVAMVIVP